MIDEGVAHGDAFDRRSSADRGEDEEKEELLDDRRTLPPRD
jgi:hypothetical protein